MTWNIDQLKKAWNLASRYHDGQKYGGHEEGMKIEYLNHIGSVTYEILNALQYETSVDGDLAISCALLHDTLEDTDLSEEKVLELFGEKVLQGVKALTKDKTLPTKIEQMQDSLKADSPTALRDSHGQTRRSHYQPERPPLLLGSGEKTSVSGGGTNDI